MTAGKLLGFGLLFAIVTGFIKLFVYNILNADNFFVLSVFYVFTVLFAIALVRRLGIINYLESFVALGFWLLLTLLFDIIMFGLVGFLEPYKKMSFWIFYIILIFVVFFLHKKRHVDIRKGGTGK